METDPWEFLQAYTAARIARGRAGYSLPTRALLDFQLDHARARDAVYSTLETGRLLAEIDRIQPRPVLLQSQAPDRRTYLQRPDQGRRLDAESWLRLQTLGTSPADLSIVVADGLSATAINTHVTPLLSQLVPELVAQGWTLAPICLVQQGRVAIADEVAYALKTNVTLILIGERPGLTSPDSLGAYLTYVDALTRPRSGLTDESRNCVSNIRPEGMPYDFATQKLLYLLTEMKTRKLSGVQLKDEMGLLDG
ncbi:ethanolamine ammonia-lyase subunit EutC [uncultured Fibrella sp.]|uniref:ethanolamine ammonia-lyase subunit EutC n=1 Tax=uncultured Fibrella sp. TaxID=1284596 RepID=UPI0035CAB783